MSAERELLADIAANPDEDGLRLVYADWLEEHGQLERAEFIRLQCQAFRLPEDHPRRSALLMRARNLLDAHPGWKAEAGQIRRSCARSVSSGCPTIRSAKPDGNR
jgi:uncharacterized protein (TIGR02996 family)